LVPPYRVDFEVYGFVNRSRKRVEGAFFLDVTSYRDVREKKV